MKTHLKEENAVSEEDEAGSKLHEKKQFKSETRPNHKIKEKLEINANPEVSFKWECHFKVRHGPEYFNATITSIS